MEESSVVTKAEAFAREAHKDHVRNDVPKTQYVNHLEEVAYLVEKSGGTDNEIAGAWLHDTVEDTEVTMEDIKREFPEEVAYLVYHLTDLDEWLSLPLDERKAKQAERVKKESTGVRRIKLADQTSNVGIMGRRTELFPLENMRIYIEGAKGIAEACKGVSEYLDEEFEKRYQEAKHKLHS